MTPGQRCTVTLWDDTIEPGTLITGQYVIRYSHGYKRETGQLRLVSVRLDSGRTLPFDVGRVSCDE